MWFKRLDCICRFKQHANYESGKKGPFWDFIFLLLFIHVSLRQDMNHPAPSVTTAQPRRLLTAATVVQLLLPIGLFIAACFKYSSTSVEQVQDSLPIWAAVLISSFTCISSLVVQYYQQKDTTQAQTDIQILRTQLNKLVDSIKIDSKTATII